MPDDKQNESSDHTTRKVTPIERVVILVIVVGALALRVGTAVTHQSLAHPDEIFQTQEPAHQLAFGYSVRTWEWREGVRSWVFPLMLAGIMRLTEKVGSGSSGYVTATAIFLSLISLSTVWFGYKWARRASGIEAALIAAGCCAVWYELVLFAARALTEVVAAHALLPGLYLGIYGDEITEKRRMFLAGLFCGVAAALRVQLLLAVFLGMIYFCRERWRERLRPLVMGALVPAIIFGVVDACTWSYPFQSYYRYIWVNVIEGRSSLYGTQPWFWYISLLLTHLGPLAVLAAIGVRRSPILGWLAFIMVAAHSMISHKESRFIYPAVPLAITLASIGIVEIAKTCGAIWKSPLRTRIVVGGSVAFVSAMSFWLSAQFVYRAEDGGGLAAFRQLSRDPNVCGIGLHGVAWLETGGYTYLHRRVPIFPLIGEYQAREASPGFNALLSFGTLDRVEGNFHLQTCWGEVCLYKRPGLCKPNGLGELNSELKLAGE
jgi:phosphatidylinositol glycan class B